MAQRAHCSENVRIEVVGAISEHELRQSARVGHCRDFKLRIVPTQADAHHQENDTAESASVDSCGPVVCWKWKLSMRNAEKSTWWQEERRFQTPPADIQFGANKYLIHCTCMLAPRRMDELNAQVDNGIPGGIVLKMNCREQKNAFIQMSVVPI
jgi:hypothetical protein